MKIKHLAVATVAMSLLASSALVQAQPQAAVTARHTNLRAGPAPDYPVVAVLPAGFAVGVQGCLPDYTWCDVIAGQSRGWMWAGNINYYYQNSYVPLLNYGPAIGIGAISFFLGDYWGAHYRDRPFYRDRGRWEGRHFGGDSRYGRPNSQGLQYVVPRGERDRADIDRRRAGPNAAPPAPRVERQRGADAPRAAAPAAAAPPMTRQQRRDVDNGGSSSVDPRLRPSY
jgi:uncharacterized protein YraI